MIENQPQSIRWSDPKIYGINWDAEDDDPLKQVKPRQKEKPFCRVENCFERVSTEHGRPKPYCKDHVFENPYVQDLLKRYELLDEKEDRKKANAAFKKAEQLDDGYKRRS